MITNPYDKLYGYAGKILRIDLTNGTTETIDTAKYAPKYIGGGAIANAIFWDEVRGNVKAYDPENKIVLMTGVLTGTGLPASGHSTITGISPASMPEQYSRSSMGGLFGTTLKYAGYDGFILEGKSEKPVYVLISSKKVQFLDATDLWGKLVAETQTAIKEKHGELVQSIVIGPAGENRCRTATLTSSNDSVSGKAGFGAVFGSKNCKAIAVLGDRGITPYSVDKILEIRRNPSNAPAHPNPAKPAEIVAVVRTQEGGGAQDASLGDQLTAAQTCCAGCNDHCSVSKFNIDDPISGNGKVGMISKCIDVVSVAWQNDCGFSHGRTMHSKKQEQPGAWRWCAPSVKDPTEQDGKFLMTVYPGDRYDLWDTNVEFSNAVLWCCNQYGLDKWEMICMMFTWLKMLEKEHLLDFDTGCEGEIISAEFANQFIRNMAFRIGQGDIFAEGVARAIRHFGKEKYGDSIYHGRFNAFTGERLDIPVSFEAAWGSCSHWLGRGFQGCEKATWIHEAICWMLDTRDGSSNNHPCEWVDEYLQYRDDPCHSPELLKVLMETLDEAAMKDCLTLCDFRFPNPTWPEQETECFEAATGIRVTDQDLIDVGTISRLLYRSVLIRNYGRIRDFEVEAIFPWITWPDPFGKRAGWDEFNDLVDSVYQANGWDIATGWPFRSTYEKYGLGYVADELESLGLLPPEGGTPGYVRKEWDRPMINCPARD